MIRPSLISVFLVSILGVAAQDALTPEICSTYDVERVAAPADSAHAIAADALIASGTFARVFEARAVLHTGVGVGNISGGGTNTYGAYFTFEFDADSLPDGVCDEIPTSGGGALCTKSNWLSSPSGLKTINVMMGPSDAIVFYGCTPPPTEYFG